MLKSKRTSMTTGGLVETIILAVLVFVTLTAHASQTFHQPPQPDQESLNRHHQYQASLKHQSDLVHSAGPTVDLPSSTFKSMSHKLTAQENQINDKQPIHPAVKNGPRSVINGNHATYVEPPANFKPIIYERTQVSPDTSSQHQLQSQMKQQQQQQPQHSPSFSESSAPNRVEPFLELPNHLVASMLPPISGQSSPKELKLQTPMQQQQQQQQQQMLKDRGPNPSEQQAGETDPSAANEDPDVEDEPNSLPLKPSIDRWSDWHDMSVDPDLASSETQLSPAGALHNVPRSNQARQQTQRQQYHHGQKDQAASQIPTTIYEQKRASFQPHRNSDALPVTNQAEDRAPLRELQVLPLINQLYHHQLQQQQRMLAANLIKMQYQPSAALLSYELKQDYLEPQSHHLLEQPTQQLKANRYDERHNSYHHRPSASTHAQLNFYTQPQQLQPQQQWQLQQQQPPTSSQLARSSFAPAGPAPSFKMFQQAQMPQMIFMPTHSAAMNNMKFNILPRSLDDTQQQQAALASANLKRARQFKSQVSNAEVNLAANQYQQPQHHYQLSAPLVLSSQHNSFPAAMQAPGSLVDKQVSAANGPALVVAVSRVSAQPIGNGAGNLAPRTLKPALLKATTQGSQSTNTTLKRVLKQRRIKTLLPVGLSSWLLGGIRDLDARHWKLPSEIMHKLAINDVDLQHPEPILTSGQSAQANTEDSSSVVDMSNQVQPGGNLEKADRPKPTSTRSPSSQLSPR